MQARRFAGFTMRTECTRCGMPLPLNAPAEVVTCNQCQTEVRVPAALWSYALERFECDERPPAGKMRTEVATVAGFSLQLQVANMKPLCEKCSAEYPVEAVAGDAATDFACTSCGDPASTWPAPDWLRKGVPTLRQIISTDPGGATAATGQALDGQLTEEPAPVAMACPQCAGSLRITAKHERIVPCQFCNTDVFLPDEVWRRLHPVKTVQWWFASFEGRTALEAQRDADEAQMRADKAAAKERAAAAFKVVPWVWIPALAFVAWNIFTVAMIIGGVRKAAAEPYVWASVAAYTGAVAASAWPIAIASGGSWVKNLVGLWLLGAVAMSPPVAGMVSGLIVLAFAAGKKNTADPASGVGRPLAVVYLAHCLFMQVMFFTHAV